MKIITFATLKGGTGKTINAFNIGSILSETKKVLLIDVDAQCNLTSDVGIDASNTGMLSVKDIFDNLPKEQPKAEEIIIKSPINELPNLDLIPSSILLFKTERSLAAKNNREHVLEYFVKNNINYLSRYDYILIDTNPSMSMININAFFLADSIILTSDVSANGIMGAEIFDALWADNREELYKDNNIKALFLCNVDMRSKKLIREMREYMSSEDYGIDRDIIMDTIIPMTVKMKDTETLHRPVNVLYPKEPVKTAYDSLISELTQKGVL